LRMRIVRRGVLGLVVVVAVVVGLEVYPMVLRLRSESVVHVQ